MSRRLLPLIVLVIVMVGAFLSRAGEPDLKTISTNDLIVRLGSAEFAEREQGSKALQARGPSTLPALRKAVKHRDAEVRRRVKELIPLLEHVAAVAPKRVTLSEKQAIIPGIIHRLETQTGYLIEEPDFDNPSRFTFEMKDVTFWEALEQIRREAGFVVTTNEVKTRIRLKRGKESSPFICVDGSFRLELLRIHEDRNINFGVPGKDQEIGLRENLMTLTVSVMAEPRFILLATEKAHVELAVDEDNKSLVLPVEAKFQKHEEGRPENQSYLQIQRPAEILLRRPTIKARTIKELRGFIPVQVVAERKPIMILEKHLESKGTKFKVGAYSVVVQAEPLNENTFFVNQRVSPDHEGIGSSALGRLFMEDKNGRRFNPQEGSLVIGGSKLTDNPTIFSKPDYTDIGPPTKLYLEAWTVEPHFIPFVFKDVPLP